MGRHVEAVLLADGAPRRPEPPTVRFPVPHVRVVREAESLDEVVLGSPDEHAAGGRLVAVPVELLALGEGVRYPHPHPFGRVVDGHVVEAGVTGAVAAEGDDADERHRTDDDGDGTASGGASLPTADGARGPLPERPARATHDRSDADAAHREKRDEVVPRIVVDEQEREEQPRRDGREGATVWRVSWSAHRLASRP